MDSISDELIARFARCGVATVYEASGREGLIDLSLTPLHPGAHVAGRALPVMCGQDDNLMVHACIEQVKPGDVVILAMPEPQPIGLIGDLLYTQLAYRSPAAVLVAAACRDVAELRQGDLPVWTRFISAKGATKDKVGTVGEPIEVGGVRVGPGDVVVLDDDGAVVVSRERAHDVIVASEEREAREAKARAAYGAGELSFDRNDLRRLVEDA